MLSAKLDLPKKIFVHGYITAEGKKMSKTLGNVIDPIEIIKKYGADALRYYLLREIPPFDDGDFSQRRFTEVYNADLANGLGNLVARVAKLCETSGFEFPNRITYAEPSRTAQKEIEQFKLNDALRTVWIYVDAANYSINESRPWDLKGEDLRKSLTAIISFVDSLIPDLKIFLPETAKKIEEQFKGPRITSREPLFPRI